MNGDTAPRHRLTLQVEVITEDVEQHPQELLRMLDERLSAALTELQDRPEVVSWTISRNVEPHSLDAWPSRRAPRTETEAP